MGGAGVGPFGSMPAGSAFGVFAETFLIRALAVRENVVRLEFSAPVYMSNVLDPGDASWRGRYALSPVAGSVDARGEPARAVAAARAVVADDSDGRLVDVYLDRSLSSYPSRYVVSATGLVDLESGDPIPLMVREFDGVRAPRQAPLPELAVLSRDVANPQQRTDVPGAVVLGSYVVDEGGDLAFDQGLASYEKRVLRRLSTPRGRYAHLPGYGVLLVESVKGLARESELARLASDAEQQVRLEPDTLRATVTAERRGEMIVFVVRATTSGGRDVALAAPSPPAR